MKHRISRMVTHFRVDPEGKLWFTWCSSLRLFRDPSPDAAAPVAPKPRAMNLDPEFKIKPLSTFLLRPQKGMPLLRSNLFACPGCHAARETKLRCEVGGREQRGVGREGKEWGWMKRGRWACGRRFAQN